MPDRLFDTSLGDVLRTPMTNVTRSVYAGLNPAATGADVVLWTYTLPVYYFGQPNRGLDIYVQGAIANTTGTKRAKIFVAPTAAVVGSTISGGTLIADSGAMTISTGVGWVLSASMYKYGAYGSNTQVALHTASQNGAVVTSLITTTALTLTESGTIMLAVTGNVGTATTDLSLNLVEVDGMNV